MTDTAKSPPHKPVGGGSTTTSGPVNGGPNVVLTDGTTIFGGEVAGGGNIEAITAVTLGLTRSAAWVSALSKGTPMYPDEGGIWRVAQANGSLVQASAMGFLAQDIAAPPEGAIIIDVLLVTAGNLGLTPQQISQITEDGSIDFVVNQPYFLSATIPGKITSVQPTAGGTYAVQLMRTSFNDTMNVKIADPVHNIG